jgi:DNA-binding transcriptional LysR family regulator
MVKLSVEHNGIKHFECWIGGYMTLQQLKYMIIVAERGSITEAAKELYISQPSLSGAIKEVEKESGITIFSRCRAGVALTKEGMEFLGYARQVVQQMELLESKYIDKKPAKQRFCVSTQHYTFTTNAFVELIQHFGQERFEFILNETQTHQIVEDVRNRFSDLGILYLCNSNENVLRKLFEEYNLNFFELFTATPHIFIGKDHPLAKCASVRLDDLKPYPRLSFVQGTYESSNYSEELFSNEPVERSIKVSDRAAIVNLMVGLDGYTISSGIFPKYLQGDSIVSIPLKEDEVMHIGYILNKDKELSELGEIYVEALKQYQT